MSQTRPRYRSIVHDSARWEGFPLRPGDLVISTPPKCGTTWMQMICALLIFPKPLDRPLDEISPWLDMVIKDRDEVFARLGAQRHRRFIKTHTPLDGLPDDERVTYICVGRDPRDVAVSWEHHANLDTAAFFAARAKSVGNDDLAELLALDPPFNAETAEARFWHWIENPTPPVHATSSLRFALHHFDEAWRARDRSNVVVCHYGDLKNDLEGEMRRLAERLGIAVAADRWPGLVESASFERMRERADELVPNASERIWKQNRGFFHAGTSGQWRAFCDGQAQRRYEARVASLTSRGLTLEGRRRRGVEG